MTKVFTHDPKAEIIKEEYRKARQLFKYNDIDLDEHTHQAKRLFDALSTYDYYLWDLISDDQWMAYKKYKSELEEWIDDEDRTIPELDEILWDMHKIPAIWK